MLCVGGRRGGSEWGQEREWDGMGRGRSDDSPSERSSIIRLCEVRLTLFVELLFFLFSLFRETLDHGRTHVLCELWVRFATVIGGETECAERTVQLQGCAQGRVFGGEGRVGGGGVGFGKDGVYE